MSICLCGCQDGRHGKRRELAARWSTPDRPGHRGLLAVHPRRPLAELEAGELARSFAALADPARLRLFSLIAAQPGGEVCACALVEPLGRSQPTVSHHLKVLYEAGLVGRERRGNWIWYWVIRDRLEALRGTLAPAVQAPVRSGT